MKRSELHALVWKRPLRALAPMLAISDVGLAKLCRRHDVPIPGRGYWAKVAAGLTVHMVPLPVGADDEAIPEFRSITLSDDAQPQEQWLIPGLLAAKQPARPGVDLARLREVLAGSDGHSTQGSQSGPAATAAAPAGTASSALTAAGHLPSDGAPRSAEVPDATPARRQSRRQQPSGPVQGTPGELAGILAAAVEQAQYRAALHVLRTVAATALDEEPDTAKAIFEAAFRLRKAMRAQSTPSLLLDALRRAGSLTPHAAEVGYPYSAGEHRGDSPASDAREGDV